MCGICGKLNFNRQEPVDQQLLRKMMDLIHHRGPDGEGEYRSGPVGLGHRRLSIIDLSTGDQPMCNEDGTVWVVYNGEIYNFPEIRSDLQARGHKFKSTTDTEVIIHLYEEIGPESVKRLRGMFAFALWDERKQLLLLARDRVGVKPLYYMNTGKALLFGSEIKSILADPTVKRCINPHAIDRFITYYYLPGSETLLEGIYKLEPGHYLTVIDGKISNQQYWDLEYPISPARISYQDAVHELRSLLRHTVKDHMISDVPVGVLLSGGVDSTGILRYAAEQSGKPIYTFTVGFEGQTFADERPYAKIAAQQFGTKHQEITFTAADFCEFLPKYIWHMEEPICEPPAVALYYVSRLAQSCSVKVLLSGEGGDEAFGGYQNYRNLLLLENLKSLLGPARNLLGFGFEFLEMLGWKRIAPYSGLINLQLSEYYLSRTAGPSTPFNQMKQKLYSKDFIAALRGHNSGLPTQSLFEKIKNHPYLSQMLYVDTKTWLPDDLLVKADKITMATSVELRVPLLDYRVLEFAAALPQKYKVAGWKLKRILKDALRDSVPKVILDRKKTGFPVPYDKWLLKESKDFAFDILSGKNIFLSSYFKNTQILKILELHMRGAGFSKEVFSLLVLELWFKVFMGERNESYA